MENKPSTWKIATIILGLLLVISIFTNGFNFKEGPSGITGNTIALTSQEAADKAVEYINSYLLQPGITASLVSVKDNGNLYNAQIDIDGNIYDSYITKDGKLLFPTVVVLDDTNVAQPTPTGTSTAPIEVSADDDPSIGPEDAPITIIEFSDYECPFSTRAEPTIKQVLETYGDKVRFVYRDFPLSFHQNAQISAEASECARDQRKFWEYHDKLFETGELNPTSLKKHAEDLGLDTKKFNECLDSGKYKDEVKKDFQDGQAAGVRGTPAFFINGEKLVGAQPFEAFKEIIDRQLR